jgi:hypothetical protein
MVADDRIVWEPKGWLGWAGHGVLSDALDIDISA